MAISADGAELASGSLDGTVKVWDTANGRNLFTLVAQAEQFHCVAFSPDGKRLAMGSSDPKVKVWDFAETKRSLALPGHAEGVAAWRSAAMENGSPAAATTPPS